MGSQVESGALTVTNRNGQGARRFRSGSHRKDMRQRRRPQVPLHTTPAQTSKAVDVAAARARKTVAAGKTRPTGAPLKYQLNSEGSA